jgi:CubicO group peptidase (beta-lactamase class C family)
MSALGSVADWPVDHVAAAIVTQDGVEQIGDPDFEFRLASLTKPMTAWAIMIATEEGVLDLDGPLRHVSAPEGATMRHLLSHAAGFGFDGTEPIAPIERKRIYSNTGFELAAEELEGAASMSFGQYFDEALLQPLLMERTGLHGSAAHRVRSTLADTIRFVAEMRRPALLASQTAAEIIRPQYPELAGIVPGVGRFDPCPWGLGVELSGGKSPHWMGRAVSPATFGHFGGAGTMMWVDPVADIGVVALTDRPFDDWSTEAVARWTEFSDAAVAEARGDR